MSSLDYYSYKGTPLSALIKGLNAANSNTTDAKNAFNLNSVNSVQPFSSIDETPSPVSITYKGTDISDYSIANYIIPTNNQPITVPSWCTSIRYVLCGGGGGGGASTARTVTVGNNHNSGYNWGWTGYFQHNSATYTQNGDAYGGSGGGAGGFSYESRLSITPSSTISVTVGNGGAPGTNGGDTTLVINNATTISALGGKGGTTVGGAGGVGATVNGGTGDKYSGVTGGTGGTQSRNNAGKFYGNGGSGRTTTAHSDTPLDGDTGSHGFVLIYFIK